MSKREPDTYILPARFSRYVEQPVTLNDGTKIPANVIIESPFIAIARDPELYPNPDVNATSTPLILARLANIC